MSLFTRSLRSSLGVWTHGVNHQLATQPIITRPLEATLATALQACSNHLDQHSAYIAKGGSWPEVCQICDSKVARFGHSGLHAGPSVCVSFCLFGVSNFERGFLANGSDWHAHLLTGKRGYPEESICRADRPLVPSR